MSCLFPTQKITSCWQRCHLVAFRAVQGLLWLGWHNLIFLRLLLVSTCLSPGILVKSECAEYVLTSQFIVTLAGGLSHGCHCSKSQRAEGACKMERAVSIWPGFVCGGACGAGWGSSIFPLGLSREVETSKRCKGTANWTGLGHGQLRMCLAGEEAEWPALPNY